MKYSIFFTLLFGSFTAVLGQSFSLKAFDKPDRFELTVTGQEEIQLRLENLALGDQYEIFIANDRRENRYEVGNYPAGTTLINPDHIQGVYDGRPVEVCLVNRLRIPGPLLVSVRKKSSATASAAKRNALTIVNSSNLDSLLNTVFRDESCFTLDPVQLVGGDRMLGGNRRVSQTGVFGNGRDFVGIEDGIILSTGFVDDAPGPNDPFFPAGGSYPGPTYNDPDAVALVGAGNTPFDVGIIEFKFVPTTDTISFDYVFFSEEYCFAIDAAFGNDAFAFFLEGPNVQPNGRRNIARLPNGDIITAATLNHVTTPGLFVDNSPPGGFSPCTNDPIPPERLAAVNYDGFSVKLTAKAAVTPCDTHTLKMIVVDAGDPTFDSGVMLEAGSFTAGLIAEPVPSTTAVAGGVTPVEGCDTATLTFSRLFFDSTDLAVPLSVEYSVITTTGLNRAINGVDYDLPPSPFVIPAGDTTGVLKIPINADADPNEGVEAFVIRYEGTCNCDVNRDTFYIQDATALEVELGPDIGTCAGAEIQLSPNVMGGNGEYSYQWPDNQDTSTITYVSDGRDTSIIVIIEDGCGLVGRDTINIGAPTFSAGIGGTYALCNDPSVDVPITVTGASRYELTIRIDSAGISDTNTYVITGDSILTIDQAATLEILSVEDENGCGGGVSGTAQVTETSVVFDFDLVNPDCPGDNTGSIQLMGAPSDADYQFVWDDGFNGPTRNGLVAGTYTVSIIPNADPSCPQDTTFSLVDPAALRLDSIVFEEPQCPGEILTLSPAVSGGQAPYRFSWPDSMVTDSQLVITSTFGNHQYPVIIRDACDVEVSGSVTINLPIFSANVAGRYSLCNQNSVDVPLIIGGPGGTYFLEVAFETSSGIDTTTVTLSPGTLNLPVSEAAAIRLLGITNEDGCSGLITDSLATVVDPRINFSATVNQIDCRGAATGSISLTNPGNVPLTFSWSDGGPATATRTGLTAGTYGLTITDAADPGCSRDTTFTLAEPDALTGSANADNVTCGNQPLRLFATVSGGTPPYNFDWSNGTSTDSILSGMTQTGMSVYPLLITDACGDTVRDTVRFDFPDVRASIGGSYSVCNQPTVDVPLQVSGSNRYEVVLLEDGVARTLTISQDTLLTYDTGVSLTLQSVSGADGCPGVATGTATITDADWEVAVTVTNVSCNGRPEGAITVVPNGNAAAYDYQWSRPGVSGSQPSGLTAGTYGLTITDRSPDACTWDTLIQITEPATAITLVEDSTRVQDCVAPAYASVSYTGGTGNLTYAWSNGTTGNVLGDVDAGNYEVSVTDENGCEIVQTFNLPDQRSTVVARISASATELSCNLPMITLSAQQNVQPVNYQWTDETGNDLGATRSIQISSPGKYYVSATDPASGCSALDSITIQRSDDLLDLELPAVYTIICGMSSVDLLVSHPTYTDPVDYEWRLGPNTVGGNAASLPGIDAAGTYEVTVTRRDNGCPTTISTQVIIDQVPPTVSVPNSVVNLNCLSPEVELRVLSSPDVQYAWSTTNGNLTGDVSAATTTADQEGIYVVTVTDTSNNCFATQTITVVPDGAQLTPDAGPDQTLVCDGIGNTLRGSFSPQLGGATGRWIGPDGVTVSEGFTAFGREAGQYVFEVIHPQSGCSSFDTLELILEAPRSVTYSLQQPPCPEVGGRLTILDVDGDNGPFTFSSPSATSSPTGDGLRDIFTGTHALVVTDALGCQLVDTFQMFDPDVFVGEADEITVRLGDEAELGVNTNRDPDALMTWEWANLPDSMSCVDCPNPMVRPLESFIAALTVTDSNGCVLQLRQNVLVDERELVYLPTAFSPGNQDGVNDRFVVFGREDFVQQVNFLRIFDRWGNLLFENDNFPVNEESSGWDGTIRGKSAPPAVYVFSVSVTLYDGTTEVIQGSFVLVM
ncbi:choice-of-anchor L domain-containing protein [Lewinella sp. W8]|uniref:choice-of-anchor L domain-containing protein n=1 Tax=Lewinella sp. W8 TaxID=2528208 RepID=UPI001067711D|nr:choice-of-anchor L domain-containing protein [Lewinella sp. W8]MTB52201.1 T9SS type B sorting domain-containing protein [Lewinella sp. W8]